MKSSTKTSNYYVWPVRSGQCGSFGDLVISKSGTGAGTVTSADGKINCGSDCTETYPGSSTEVTLTATAASGSTFAGWSGGGCTGTGQCVVTVTGNVTVTATFNIIPTTTTTTVCPSPDLTTPDGAGIAPRPTFSWQKVDGVTWYQVSVYYGAVNYYAANQWFDAAVICAGTTCSAQLSNALYPGQYSWWLNTWSDSSCGWQVQPGGKYKQFTVTGCEGPVLVSPISGTVAFGANPNHVFTSNSAEWINLCIYSSAYGVVSSQWVAASAACILGNCSVAPARWIMALGQNWWWLNTWSTQCGLQVQPGGNIGGYAIIP